MFRDTKQTSAVSLHPFMQMMEAEPKKGGVGHLWEETEGEPLISLKTSRQPNSKLVLLIENEGDGRETEKEAVLLL